MFSVELYGCDEQWDFIVKFLWYYTILNDYVSEVDEEFKLALLKIFSMYHKPYNYVIPNWTQWSSTIFYTLFNRMVNPHVIQAHVIPISALCHSTSNYGILIWLVILMSGPIHDMGQMIHWGWRDSSIMHGTWSTNPINLNWPKNVVTFKQFWVFLSLQLSWC